MTTMMKYVERISPVSFILLPILLASNVACPLAAASLDEDFRHPPAAARPLVWWHWMGANISKEGITKDLEAMKAAGIGGATIFNVTSGLSPWQAPIKDLPWPDRTYHSPSWWECVRHAAAEAKRLGLELGLHNTVGYSSTGGPWIADDQGMKHVVWSETEVTGGTTMAVDLPTPKPNLRSGPGGMPEGSGKNYRDISVIAVPVLPAGEVIPQDRVLDVQAHMDDAGHFAWQDAPPGTWRIVRLGYNSIGTSPFPMPEEMVGKAREADKLSHQAMTYHWSTVVDSLQEHLGGLVGDSVRHLLIDSYEAGGLNWTEGFRNTFIKRFGYDPVPWLATRCSILKGKKDELRIIGSADQTARFTYDLQTIIAEEFATHVFSTGKDILHRSGLALQVEPYGGPFDTVTGSYLVDVPLGEFWSTTGGGVPQGVVAGGQAGGHRVIGAESFTGNPQVSGYTETPAMLQPDVLGTFAAGINRLHLHHWVHQPFGDDIVPGLCMGYWGTHFGRHQTWFEAGKSWFEFVSRCQFLLQQGEAWVPVVGLGQSVDGSDAIPVRALLTDVRVEHGDIVLTSGRRYAVLAIPKKPAMEPELIAKIRALLESGATVVGTAPERSPSLRDYPTGDDTVKKLAGEVWKPGAYQNLFADVKTALKARGIESTVQVRSGNVKTVHRTASDAEIVYVANLEPRSQWVTLSLRGDQRQPEIWNPEDGTVVPAPVWQTVRGHLEVPFTIPARTARFVVLRDAHRRQAVDALKITAGSAELVATPDGPALRTDTSVSATVTKGMSTTTVTGAPSANPVVVSGPWSLTFQGRGTSGGSLTLQNLGSWSDQSDPQVRYASGTGIYRVTADIPAAWLENRGRVMLDLGEVRDTAVVTCNDVAVATVWQAPYRVDLTAAIHPGSNTLSISVSNTWHNRLIGDEQEPDDAEWITIPASGPKPAGRLLVRFPSWLREGKPRPATERRCFATWNYVTKESPLIPAGLMGPVTLVPVAELLLLKETYP